jgi:hypothetical protein
VKGARASTRFIVRHGKPLEAAPLLSFWMLKWRERRVPKRFQISRQIINAFFAAMRFDEVVKRHSWQPGCLPACIGGEFGVLMDSANQLGAGL